MQRRYWHPSSNKQLQKGIAHHSLEDVKEALQRGANVEKIYKVIEKTHVKTTRKLNSLIHALMLGNKEIISTLLERASLENINTKTYVKHETRRGVSYTTTHNNDYSPLLTVFLDGKVHGRMRDTTVDIVKLLIKSGAKIQGEDEQEGAIQFLRDVLEDDLHQDEALSLCEAFASIGLNLNKPKWLMRTAIEYGNSTVVNYLFEHSNIKLANHLHGWTLLEHAINDNQIKLMEEFIQQGADVNQKDKDGGTALRKAIDRNNSEAVKILLAHGADFSLLNRSGKTPPLITALDKQKKQANDMVSLLLNANADINQRDSAGRLPLEIAIEKCDVKTFKTMLAYKQDIHFDLLTSKNETLLIQALNQGKTAKATMLIEKNCHLDTANAQGDTPLHIATKRDYTSIATLLAQKCSLSCLNAINDEAETALFIAAKQGNADLVSLLLQAGAEDLANRNGINAELISKNNHIRSMIVREHTNHNQFASTYSPTLFPKPIIYPNQGDDIIYLQPGIK